MATGAALLVAPGSLCEASTRKRNIRHVHTFDSSEAVWQSDDT